MKIIIPGVPVPQARMRHFKRGGFVGTYDPNAEEKAGIRRILQSSYAPVTPVFPRVSFLFYMPIPKSIPKKKMRLYESGTRKHDKKPDVDNLVKLYLDCLDGIVLDGDQKVSLGPCLKVYHKEPKTIVWVHSTTQSVQPWELDVAFLGVEEPDIPSFCVTDYLSGSYDLWTQVRGLYLRS